MDPPAISPAAAGRLVQAGSLHQSSEIMLTGAIFLFGILSFAVLLALAKFGKANEAVLRVYVVTLVIIGTLMIVSSSYSTDQIAPVVGLFGTIAGYVLGKTGKKEENDGD